MGASISHDLRLTPLVRKGRLGDINESEEDVQYWLSRPVKERMEAVTFLITQYLEEGQCMDKSVIKKKRLKRKWHSQRASKTLLGCLISIMYSLLYSKFKTLARALRISFAELIPTIPTRFIRCAFFNYHLSITTRSPSSKPVAIAFAFAKNEPLNTEELTKSFKYFSTSSSTLFQLILSM